LSWRGSDFSAGALPTAQQQGEIIELGFD
jgi:hypothetical protein